MLKVGVKTLSVTSSQQILEQDTGSRGFTGASPGAGRAVTTLRHRAETARQPPVATDEAFIFTSEFFL